MKSTDFSQYDPTLRQAINKAIVRIESTLAGHLPLSGPHVGAWLKYLSRTGSAADYYHQVPISPMFWFPRFLEKTFDPGSPSVLQEDLVYSTINGYYYIRLIDNLMDHHAAKELDILPSLGFFHTEFQTPYQKYFAYDHPFWELFREVWFHAADVTTIDARLTEQSLEQFNEIASQKICAIKIPAAAVAYYYGHREVIPAWSEFVDSFGRWHQMHSDVFHWHEDLSQGVQTFFLSSARQRKSAEEPLMDWMLREGFRQGLDLLDEWMAGLQHQALSLGSKELSQYLTYRQKMTRKEGLQALKGLGVATKISSLLF